MDEKINTTILAEVAGMRHEMKKGFENLEKHFDAPEKYITKEEYDFLLYKVNQLERDIYRIEKKLDKKGL